MNNNSNNNTNLKLNYKNIEVIEPMFARSASAITPNEKSLINTNKKSTTRFPMSLRRSSYVAPKTPKGA